MQSARPRVLLAPLQLGLGVQMHHHFQSRFLVDTLHNHGYCCSYSEVKKYERCASVIESISPTPSQQEYFFQYAADNVDHNVRTLDGKNTFHGMGIIAAFTPKIKTNAQIKKINVSPEDIVFKGRINLQSFVISADILANIHYECLRDLNTVYSNPNVNFIWKISPVLNFVRPLWSSFMQMIHKGEHPTNTSVLFLPIIDLNPNNPASVFSTLKFVCDHAKKFNCTPVITFDQPLWWKAYMIIQSLPENDSLRSAVVRLGGFHIQMSFLGSIGHLMKGSVIENVLEVLYSENTIGHILSGKAVSRAVRGHFIVDASLASVLTAKLLHVNAASDAEADLKVLANDTTMNCSSSNFVQELSLLMEQLLSGSITPAEVESNDLLN